MTIAGAARLMNGGGRLAISGDGQARYLEMEGMTHGFLAGGRFDEELARAMIDWLQEQAAAH